MMRTSCSVIAARVGSRWNRAVGTCGKSAMKAVITISASETHAEYAQTSCHADFSSVRSRSVENTGITTVMTAYRTTAATRFTSSRALTKPSVAAVVPYEPAMTISRASPNRREIIVNDGHGRRGAGEPGRRHEGAVRRQRGDRIHARRDDRPVDPDRGRVAPERAQHGQPAGVEVKRICVARAHRRAERRDPHQIAGAPTAIRRSAARGTWCQTTSPVTASSAYSVRS